MRNAFCTVVSKGRLLQALALFFSLYRVMEEDDFCFIALCVDDAPYNLLTKMKQRMNWKNIQLLQDKQFAEEIRILRSERKIHEYCWTLKPVLTEKVMLEHPLINRVTYVDSDLFFWEDPRIIFENQSDASVLLSREEKFNPSWNPATLKKVEEKTGKYNSGFISFANDDIGQACLRWWKEKCIECCTLDSDEGKFGDQKYLDEMPLLFPNVCDITTPGVNLGPWNFLKYRFDHHDGKILIGQTKLIFYHFSGLRIVSKNDIQIIYGAGKNGRVPFIYRVYKEALERMITFVEKVEPGFNEYAAKDDLEPYWKK